MNVVADPFTAEAEVRTAGDQDGALWMQYAATRAGAAMGHHWGWRRVLCEVLDLRPHYLIATRDTHVVGILPLAEVRGVLFGHSLVSLPFVASAGPLFDDQQACDALIRQTTRLADRLNVSHVELRNSARINEQWAQQDLYVFFQRELSADHEENLKKIPRKQRAMVRKGISNNLTSCETDAKTMHRLYADNVHRHGTPGQSLRYFECIKEVFGDRCSYLLVNAPDGKALSSVASIYWGDTVSANDFKYWELMRRAADNGTKIFDYGRSKRGTGPYDFKKNWGFEPTPLHYEYLLRSLDSVPQKNPLNPKFRIMIETWRRMPRWFVNAAGPRIVRTLG
jgi:FemAB-related protein (PEP-CTERM system-associated)